MFLSVFTPCTASFVLVGGLVVALIDSSLEEVNEPSHTVSSLRAGLWTDFNWVWSLFCGFCIVFQFITCQNDIS